MKNIVFLIATLFSLVAHAQSSVYHPFPTTNANWFYQYYDDFHQPTSAYGSYEIIGDTIFSGINYKRISGCTSQGSCDYGGIRDSNKIIYFRPDTATIEYVLYDFNLNIGDTLFNPYGGSLTGSNTVTVMYVDSVMTSDGYHRRLLLSTYNTWIEGVGDMEYLFSPAGNAGTSGNDVLICMTTDSGFTFPTGTSACIASVNEQAQPKNNIIISPNPFHANAQLQFGSEFENSELIIFNTIGTTLRKEKISGQLSYELNRNELLNGIYFIQLINAAGQIIMMKFIVE